MLLELKEQRGHPHPALEGIRCSQSLVPSLASGKLRRAVLEYTTSVLNSSHVPTRRETQQQHIELTFLAWVHTIDASCPLSAQVFCQHLPARFAHCLPDAEGLPRRTS